MILERSLAEPVIGGYTTFSEYEVNYVYENGVRLNIRTTRDDSIYGAKVNAEGQRNGIRFEGENGWIWVNRDQIKASDPEILKAPLPDGATLIAFADVTDTRDLQSALAGGSRVAPGRGIRRAQPCSPGNPSPHAVQTAPMHRFANPTRFVALARMVQPWAMAVALVALMAGLWFSLLASPPDYQQSDTVRIMYVHVPAAWMAMFCYSAMAGASAVALVWKHAVAHVTARATAPIGAAFTFLALVTGSLWGKPMWGTWWVWDARLTSVLILFFLYLGYMALENAFDDRARGAKAAAILAIVGAVNVPIIKFSVDWWNTLHQPASVVRLGGPSIHPSMMTPLVLMAVGYTAFYIWVLALRVRADINMSKVRAIKLRNAEA